MAGPGGALLMVCPPPRSPGDGSSEASFSVGGSVLRQTSDATAASAAAAEEAATSEAGAADAVGAAAQHEAEEPQRGEHEQQERLAPTGQPLRRSKSRRWVGALLCAQLFHWQC